MSLIILGRGSLRRLRPFIVAIAGAAVMAACSSAPAIPPPADQPLQKETLMLLGRKGMEPGAPIFIRIFKEESELEVWKARDDGRFYHFKTYPICHWSGELGPKLKFGDRQAPEGFYLVNAFQMNPNSQFHLAFNIGYPNAYDRANDRTGDSLMVHGKCKSAGCYAMTDALMEEIYGLVRESFKGGQEYFHVHAFPFRMTRENLVRNKKSPWYPFWLTLKQGYDFFEDSRLPPTVAVCERRYIVNVKLPQSRVDPEGLCPVFERPYVQPFVPRPNEQRLAEERIVVRGPKLRAVANVETGAGAPPVPAIPAEAQARNSGTTLSGLGSKIDPSLGFSQ